MYFSVSYERKEGHNYEALEAALKKKSAHHALEATWLIPTAEFKTTQACFDHFKPLVGDEGCLLVQKVSKAQKFRCKKGTRGFIDNQID